MYGRKRFSRGALATLLATALCAGVALAATVVVWESVPEDADFFIAECVLEPGSEGAVVYGSPTPRRPGQGGMPGCDDVDFSVVFDEEGDIVINCEVAGSYSPNAVYEVVATACKDGDDWMVDLWVIDTGTGEFEAFVPGEAMPGRPAEVVAEAKDVLSLEISAP